MTTNMLASYWPDAPHWLVGLLFWSGPALIFVPLPSWLLWLGWKNRRTYGRRTRMIFGVAFVICRCALGVVGLSIIAAGDRPEIPRSAAAKDPSKVVTDVEPPPTDHVAHPQIHEPQKTPPLNHWSGATTDDGSPAYFPDERTDDPFGDIKRKSDHDLIQITIRFAAQMRTFELNIQTEQLKIMNQPMSMETFSAHTQAQMDASRKATTEFRNTYLHPALMLRDELKARLARLGIFDIPEVVNKAKPPLTAFDGWPVGPSSIADAADYIERLARRLQSP
jgi:hypothetical protein